MNRYLIETYKPLKTGIGSRTHYTQVPIRPDIKNVSDAKQWGIAWDRKKRGKTKRCIHTGGINMKLYTVQVLYNTGDYKTYKFTDQTEAFANFRIWDSGANIIETQLISEDRKHEIEL